MNHGLKIEGQKVLLFTGHMIDDVNRQEPRFPKEREAEIRRKIKDGIENMFKSNPSADDYIGISGGACGGDLLFLEICKTLGISIKMLLALPAEKYIAESVAFAGSSWVDRFYHIYEDADTEVRIMAETKGSPTTSNEQNNDSFWERNNLWLLNTALAYGGHNLTLIAVWDGKGEDGPGGTKHMIEEIQKRGASSIVIEI